MREPLPPLTRKNLAWLAVAALAAFAAKLYCAWTTIGSNDVKSFYQFATVIDAGGLLAAYQLGPVFNHPPLVGNFLSLIYWISETYALPFPFLLRLPSIIADLATVVVLLWTNQRHPALRVPFFVWLIFALSPVSFMVAGYHGNTDPVLTFFLVLAAIMCLENRPVACGLFLALSLHVKVVGLIVSPVYFFFWLARSRSLRFAAATAAVLLIGWWEPLTSYPVLLLKNVLGYSSYWGFWGITYWLKLTHFTPFYGHSFFEPSPAQQIVVTILKSLIFGSVMVLSWRRRYLPAGKIFSTLALAWSIFFILAPGTAPQYLVWPASFLLFYSIPWYLAVTGTSSVFLFFFYNAISRGMPWFYGSSDALVGPWCDPWAIWPWLTFGVGLYWIWKTAGRPRIFTLESVREGSEPST